MREYTMTGTRQLAKIFGAIAAILLFALVNPWFTPEGTIATAITLGFWGSSIVLLVLLFQERKVVGSGEATEVEGPAITRFLFNNTGAGLFWLPIRLFVGFAWLEAGWHKLTSDGWINNGGSSLAGYWTHATAIPDGGKGVITYEWYQQFITTLLNGGHAQWFAWVITFGELAVGVGLVLGILTGFAAFSGALMSMSFMLAGSGSTNPVMFFLAIGLILAWKVAGYYGLDRVLLPMLGTPWHPGRIKPASGGPTATPVPIRT
jgi:thiosulfate dehydrogenase [quinone] large subunit